MAVQLTALQIEANPVSEQTSCTFFHQYAKVHRFARLRPASEYLRRSNVDLPHSSRCILTPRDPTLHTRSHRTDDRRVSPSSPLGRTHTDLHQLCGLKRRCVLVFCVYPPRCRLLFPSVANGRKLESGLRHGGSE